jgi:chromosome segregation ATPase
MALSASAAEMLLREIAERIQANQKRLNQASAVIADVETDIATMTVQYAQLITQLNQLAQQAPTDAVIQNWKARKDKMVIEFNELKATAGLMRVAIASITG